MPAPDHSGNDPLSEVHLLIATFGDGCSHVNTVFAKKHSAASKARALNSPPDQDTVSTAEYLGCHFSVRTMTITTH